MINKLAQAQKRKKRYRERKLILPYIYFFGRYSRYVGFFQAVRSVLKKTTGGSGGPKHEEKIELRH